MRQSNGMFRIVQSSYSSTDDDEVFEYSFMRDGVDTTDGDDEAREEENRIGESIQGQREPAGRRVVTLMRRAEHHVENFSAREDLNESVQESSSDEESMREERESEGETLGDSDTSDQSSETSSGSIYVPSDDTDDSMGSETDEDSSDWDGTSWNAEDVYNPHLFDDLADDDLGDYENFSEADRLRILFPKLPPPEPSLDLPPIPDKKREESFLNLIRHRYRAHEEYLKAKKNQSPKNDDALVEIHLEFNRMYADLLDARRDLSQARVALKREIAKRETSSQYQQGTSSSCNHMSELKHDYHDDERDAEDEVQIVYQGTQTSQRSSQSLPSRMQSLHELSRPGSSNRHTWTGEGSREHQRNEDANKCVVCHDREADIVILKCSHLAVCMQCSQALKTCPICRNLKEDILKVYRN